MMEIMGAGITETLSCINGFFLVGSVSVKFENVSSRMETFESILNIVLMGITKQHKLQDEDNSFFGMVVNALVGDDAVRVKDPAVLPQGEAFNPHVRGRY